MPELSCEPAKPSHDITISNRRNSSLSVEGLVDSVSNHKYIVAKVFVDNPTTTPAGWLTCGTLKFTCIRKITKVWQVMLAWQSVAGVMDLAPQHHNFDLQINWAMHITIIIHATELLLHVHVTCSTSIFWYLENFGLTLKLHTLSTKCPMPPPLWHMRCVDLPYMVVLWHRAMVHCPKSAWEHTVVHSWAPNPDLI